MLEAASKLTTTRFVQHLGEFPESRGLTPPRLAIRFELEDGSRARTLKLGTSAARGQIFATTEDGPTGSVFLVPEVLFASWLKPPRNRDDLPENVFAPDIP